MYCLSGCEAQCGSVRSNMVGAWPRKPLLYRWKSGYWSCLAWASWVHFSVDDTSWCSSVFLVVLCNNCNILNKIATCVLYQRLKRSECVVLVLYLKHLLCARHACTYFFEQSVSCGYKIIWVKYVFSSYKISLIQV